MMNKRGKKVRFKIKKQIPNFGILTQKMFYAGIVGQYLAEYSELCE